MQFIRLVFELLKGDCLHHDEANHGILSYSVGNPYGVIRTVTGSDDRLHRQKCHEEAKTSRTSKESSSVF